MKSPIIFIITLFLFLSVFAVSVSADNLQDEGNAAEILSVETKAELLEGPLPEYPSEAQWRGIEGWVLISLVVKPDGTTDNIEIIGTSIDDYFDAAAIQSAKTRIYKPATSMGKPVMQGNVLVRMIFLMEDSDGGVSISFLKTYKKASKAIDDENLELAKTLIDRLEDNEKRLLAEVFYLDMLKGHYFANTGDLKAELRHVDRALVIADDVAPKPIYIKLLRQAIVDNAKTNNFQMSLEHYNTLLEIDKKLASQDPIHDLVKRVESTLHGDKNILTLGKVTRVCNTCENPVRFWWHSLSRNRFSIDMVDGELSEIEIICQNSVVSVVFDQEMVWTANRDAGGCRIRVFGDSASTFRLIELPNES
jgi:TonB family protein